MCTRDAGIIYGVFKRLINIFVEKEEGKTNINNLIQ